MMDSKGLLEINLIRFENYLNGCGELVAVNSKEKFCFGAWVVPFV